MESVYPALYDLFNQNFTEVNKKNYARLAVGTSTNTFSFVHAKFRCIVSVNYEQIDQEEAPFLNRFEKHILSLEYLRKWCSWIFLKRASINKSKSNWTN